MNIIPSMLRNVKNIPVKPYCGSWPWLNKKTGETSVFFCGLASCGREYCQKLYHFRRVRILSDLIQQYSLNRFFTITMGRDTDVHESWDRFPGIWDNVRRMLVRSFPGLRFASVMEAHKDGYPHMHGFLNRYVEQHWFSKTVSNCGGGDYVWIEAIEFKMGIEEYVNKQLDVARYVGKEQVITARQMLKPRARSFFRSENMKTEHEKEKAGESDFILVKEHIYKQTEKGFDKIANIRYNDLGMSVLNLD